ncbi:hypothetical protein GOBAR_DD20775 [Gossypium barbadense]|nr:hypothetical protein GOBAR_DD20775 [Gossypium barbadense]
MQAPLCLSVIILGLPRSHAFLFPPSTLALVVAPWNLKLQAPAWHRHPSTQHLYHHTLIEQVFDASRGAKDWSTSIYTL